MKNGYLPVTAAAIIGLLIASLAFLAYRGVPHMAIALAGMASTLVGWLLNGPKSAPEIVREYSMHPPPDDVPTESVEVRIPSYPVPKILEGGDK